MTKTQVTILFLLVLVMITAAIGLGRWSEQLNPDGIMPHPTSTESGVSASTDSANSQEAAPRDAFSFGASMGLLGCALLYFCIAVGLIIQTKSQRRKIGTFTFSIAGLAGFSFVLSYLIDDLFF